MRRRPARRQQLIRWRHGRPGQIGRAARDNVGKVSKLDRESVLQVNPCILFCDKY